MPCRSRRGGHGLDPQTRSFAGGGQRYESNRRIRNSSCLPSPRPSGPNTANDRLTDTPTNPENLHMLNRSAVTAIPTLATCLALAAADGPKPTNEDLWDIRQGTVVTRHSAVDNCGRNPATPYDIRQIFGGGADDCDGEMGNILYSDTTTAGFVNFVEWETAEPVTVRSFNLWAASDGIDNHREMAEFRLLAKSPASESFDLVLHEFRPAHPYQYASGVHGLLVSTDIKPVTARQFRAEFKNPDPFVFAPRIIELDGFDTFIGPRATIRVSQIEISWPTVDGVRYQLESRETTPGANWEAFGPVLIGTGSPMQVLDRIPESATTRLYRIRPID